MPRVEPCIRCSRKKWCSAYQRLKRLHGAWDSICVEQDHPWMTVIGARLIDEVLEIRLECTQYEEADAP